MRLISYRLTNEMVLELPLRENRLCSEEERQLPRGIELVLEVQGNVWRNPHASRSRCAWVSEKILVILGMLDFDLWTQINRKNISPAKQLMATNEIQGCRRNYWNKTCRSPPGNLAKKIRGGRNRDRTRTRQHRTEFRRFEWLAYPPAECTPNVYSNPMGSPTDSPATARLPFPILSGRQAGGGRSDPA